MSYLFYKIETTGLNQAFDQILRFTAIRTDTQFNETEQHNLLIKLRPDVIPSPKATIKHRLSIAQSMQEGLCEFEAITQIHNLLNEPGTISIGYNNLNFDDDFLRFSFYRNLLSPYTHQYKNGCQRLDLLPITIMYSLYKEHHRYFKLPIIDDKINLQFEHLRNVNQLAVDIKDQSIANIKAMIELARLLKQDSNMWDYVAGYFDKKTDIKRIEKMPVSFFSVAHNNRIGLMIGNQFGPDNKYQIPVLLLGNPIHYKNQTLWMRLDNPKLREATLESFMDGNTNNINIIRKKYGEPNIILPSKKRYWDYLSPKRQAIIEENQDWLYTNSRLFYMIIQHYLNFKYLQIPNLDVDAAIYQNGFLSDNEQILCRQFHEANDFNEKLETISKFNNINLRELASRILCRNYSDNLPDMLIKYFNGYMQCINPIDEKCALWDYRNQKKTTITDVLADIKTERTLDLDNQQLQLLEELESYTRQTF